MNSLPNFCVLTLLQLSDLQVSVQSRQKLEAQKQENLGVQKVCCKTTSSHLTFF